MSSLVKCIFVAEKIIMTGLRHLFFLIFWLCLSVLDAQSIMLKNPSFEGDQSLPISILGWSPCQRGSTPDLLPGLWNVYLPAKDGNNYLGLITREDGTYEEVVQELPISLKQNECYKINMWLAHSETYVGYNLPVRLRIWSCDKNCNKIQLLSTTKLITNTFWENNELFMDPKTDVKYLMFEAFYGPGIFVPYKGNVLIDNIGYIEKCKRA